MSIKEYLGGLDLAQLKVARQEAERLIMGKQSESREDLWVVSDRLALNIAAYRETDLEKAVERTCAEIRKQARDRPSDISVHITKESHRSSEVPDMLALDAGHPDA